MQRPRPPYTSFTLPQLRQEVGRRGLAIPPAARKINLVQALDAHDASTRQTPPTASASTQTSRAHASHLTTSAVALTHAARETPDEALEAAVARAAEVLFDVQSALMVLKAQQTSDYQAALFAVLRSAAYASGGYIALNDHEREIVTQHIVRRCQRSQSATCSNARCRMH